MKVSFCTRILLLLLFSCSPEKKVKTAFKYAKYEKVIKFYKGVVARLPKNGKAIYFLSESYRLSNRIKEVERYYANAGGP